jgi:hypothetical protein
MKLTWFGGTTVRIHIGGAILVIDPAGAPAGIDGTELVSGADVVVDAFGAGLEPVDTAVWRPQRPVRLVDDNTQAPQLACWSAGDNAMVVDAPGEVPLLLVKGSVPPLGRWVDGAVVVVFGDGPALGRVGMVVLAARAPRLLALAGDEAAVDLALAILRDGLDGSGLLALESGLAVEI